MFEGHYMGKEYHEPDLSQVLDRAWSAGDTYHRLCHHAALSQVAAIGQSCLAAGIDRIIVTAGSLPEAKCALALAQTHGEQSESC